ncbi:hypothetical protein [Photobacterium sagamiensis]
MNSPNPLNFIPKMPSVMRHLDTFVMQLNPLTLPLLGRESVRA